MAEKKPPTLKDALAGVENMAGLTDGLSQKVDGLCRVALHALETPAGQRDAEALTQVLRTIIHTVRETGDAIDYEAEKLGVVVSSGAEG